ncbi:MAG: recombinase family protein [Dehalococcoidia bacterium]
MLGVKAAIYARVSTRMQEEGGTIETQLDRISKDPLVPVKYGPYAEMEQYLDNGVSGRKKPLWERPEGKRLLADAKAGKFNVIIVYKFNRLGRHMIDTEEAIAQLFSYGITIYDVKNQMALDNNTATGKMIRQLMGMMAEFEATNGAEAMRDGLERVASSGKTLYQESPAAQKAYWRIYERRHRDVKENE